MTTQIAIRLPDELVAYLDSHVASGEATSRAAVVIRALERARYHELAERDAKIYATQGEDPDLVEFTSAAARKTWSAE